MYENEEFESISMSKSIGVALNKTNKQRSAKVAQQSRSSNNDEYSDDQFESVSMA